MPSSYGGDFKSFREARAYARSLGLSSWGEWNSFSSSGRRPADIPSTPWRQYWCRGWVSMQDWLGFPDEPEPDYYKFRYARTVVRRLKLKNQTAYRKWAASRRRPERVPKYPDKIYQGEGWVSWGDWLGNKNLGKIGRKFRPFPKARKFARSLRLKNWREWKRWAATDKRPPDIPVQPGKIYRDRGWINVADWLGYNARHERARFGSAKRPRKRRRLLSRAVKRRRRIGKKKGW